MPNPFVAADDSHKMLLQCVLRDAIEWDCGITDACASCRATGDLCLVHWDEHQSRREQYRAMIDRLQRSQELNTACTLTAGQQQTIMAAVTEAISYRQTRKAVGDLALLGAYQTLQSPPTRETNAQPERYRPAGLDHSGHSSGLIVASAGR